MTENVKDIAEKLSRLTGRKVVIENDGEALATGGDGIAKGYSNHVEGVKTKLRELASLLDKNKVQQQSQPQNWKLTEDIASVGDSLQEAIDHLKGDFDSLYEDVQDDAEPIQFYAPKGSRKKIEGMAKNAGFFTMSDFIRSKIFGKKQ